MKFQWSLLIGLIFAVIIAVFAVVNVETVPVNYVFGNAEWPLILVILGSALLGALLSGSVAIFRSFVLQRKVKQLEKEVMSKELLIANQQNEISTLQKNEPVRYQDAEPIGYQNSNPSDYQGSKPTDQNTTI